MKYKDFEGNIEDLINIKLNEIEKKHNVKILHAVESGSRAWGFASPDSDYDVRFIYVHPQEFYLKLEDTKDIIDWELDETLDINGWDLNKTLRLFHKSNTTLFEWANSPVVYHTTKNWADIYSVSQKYFSVKSSMYHYYGTAKSNFYEFLQDEYVKYKKYFYVIRPLLACKWIEEKACPPPVLFDTLVQTMVDDKMKVLIYKLLEIKKNKNEADKGKRIIEINQYIEDRIAYYKDFISEYKDDRNADWHELNQVFMKNI
ncbi:MAG: nucleotidyltransferase domain-containing protein [Bacillota bacterium]|nr:nucleotidyltransferase domain-containing protein [Bacillota bacterium]